MTRYVEIIYVKEAAHFAAVGHSLCDYHTLFDAEQALRALFNKINELRELEIDPVYEQQLLSEEMELTKAVLDFKIAEVVANIQTDFLLNDCDPYRLKQLTYTEISELAEFQAEVTSRRRIQEHGLSILFNGQLVRVKQLMHRSGDGERLQHVLAALTAIKQQKREVNLFKVPTKTIFNWLVDEGIAKYGRRSYHEAMNMAKSLIMQGEISI